MRILIALFILCCLPACAEAAEALSGDVIRLEDGREVRLLVITAAGDAARSDLQALLGQRKLVLEEGALDRYGRVTTDIYAEQDKGGKIWLQGAMLEKGDAFVYPPTGAEPRIGDLMKAEHAARQARRGIWGDDDYADLPADNPKMGYGHFAFVSGKVVKAERIKNMVYLNFGDDWRTDFTVAIAAHDLKLFKAADIDPLKYEGKIIRVRGWIKRDFGPMITVTHPAQIELLGAAPVKH